MELGKFTKTPYLVLFIVLISVGVGTASALITITLSGDVVITGFLDMTGDKITDVGSPTVSTDAATKGYVDLAPSNGILGFYSVVGSANGSNVATAVCDPGDKVTGGGGGGNTFVNPDYIAKSSGSGDRWSVTFEAGKPGPFTAVAVCADYAPEHIDEG